MIRLLRLAFDTGEFQKFDAIGLVGNFETNGSNGRPRRIHHFLNCRITVWAGRGADRVEVQNVTVERNGRVQAGNDTPETAQSNRGRCGRRLRIAGWRDREKQRRDSCEQHVRSEHGNHLSLINSNKVLKRRLNRAADWRKPYRENENTLSPQSSTSCWPSGLRQLRIV